MQLSFVAVAILALTISAKGAEVPRVSDVDEFSGEIISAISHKELRKAVETITKTIGQAGTADTMFSAMKTLEGKKFDFTRKVIDKDFGGALRQIVYYSYVSDLGFVYFRFNFKKTSTGWMLTNFAFRTEMQALFPKDFIDQ